MLSGVRSLLTLAVLVLLVVGGGAWGLHAVQSPFPQKAAGPVCTNITVHAGDHVYPGQVTVSVLNASKREGLAGRTLSSLADAGFADGHTANAPKGTDVSSVAIWAEDPTSPAVALLLTYLPGADVVKRNVNEPGVAVVVGDKFRDVADGDKSVPVSKNAAICSPSLS